mmetsp:Transcript_46666/g.129888  ORF Transcript_46666/g.129888 Transcript_46666/m.129888 type:complete len:89 (+) Transcript_46666:530-796(+)
MAMAPFKRARGVRERRRGAGVKPSADRGVTVGDVETSTACATLSKVAAALQGDPTGDAVLSEPVSGAGAGGSGKAVVFPARPLQGGSL